jgi:hypothetical protein
LGEAFVLAENAEEIYFALDEPMSVMSPDEESVEIVGYAALPIRWNDGSTKPNETNL